MTAAIEVQGLRKEFDGLVAVEGIDLEVARGRIMGFLGPNGSGKTTTIRMLCGLLTPDAGRGTCLGFDLLREAAAIKRQVGYMTQSFSFYEDLSVAENLDFVARAYSLDDRRGRVARALERLDFHGGSRQVAGELSGGWKQRLALEACILHEPRLLLLDEPTTGMDPKARRDFWSRLHELASDGVTVLVSTHYMDEAERCHAVTYIASGSLVVSGRTEEVIERAGLTAWLAEATKPNADLDALEREIADLPEVDSHAEFGNSLRITGRDGKALSQALKRFRRRKGVSWTETEPTLEEAFIALMAARREQGDAEEVRS